MPLNKETKPNQKTGFYLRMNMKKRLSKFLTQKEITELVLIPTEKSF